MKWIVIVSGKWGGLVVRKFFTSHAKARDFYTDCLVKYLDYEVTIEEYEPQRI